MWAESSDWESSGTMAWLCEITISWPDVEVEADYNVLGRLPQFAERSNMQLTNYSKPATRLLIGSRSCTQKQSICL